MSEQRKDLRTRLYELGRLRGHMSETTDFDDLVRALEEWQESVEERLVALQRKREG